MIKKQLKKELHKDAYVAPVATFYTVQMEGVICESNIATMSIGNLGSWEDDSDE